MRKCCLFLVLFISKVSIAQIQVAILEPIGITNEVTMMHRSMVRGEMVKAIGRQAGYAAFTRTDIDQIMKEQNFQRTGMVSDDQIKRLGAMQGVDYVCVTKITKEANNYYLEANLVNIESGQISNPATQYGELTEGSLSNMLAACEKLAAELLGNTTVSTTATTATTATTTTSTVLTPTNNDKEVYVVIDNFTIWGDQIIDYEDNAVGLSTLRELMEEKKEARTGCILEGGEGIVIYKNNGYRYTGLGEDFSLFKEKIKQYNNEEKKISDVTFNNKGNYVIIVGKNGYSTNGVSQNLIDALAEMNKNKETITSVSIDNAGNWAYVSDKHFRASSSWDNEKMREASKKLGYMHSVCLTTTGIIVCCENGVFFSRVPKKIVDKIIDFRRKGNIPKVVKFTDSGTFLITDGNLQYAYYM